MPIDVTEVESDGWWMQYLWRELQREQKRFARLHAYYTNRPPVQVPVDQRSMAHRIIQRVCQTNFAAAIVQAPRDRLTVRAIRTAKDSDTIGDEEARAAWVANDMETKHPDNTRQVLEFSRSYTLTSVNDNPDEPPIITVEDPRQMVTYHDPLRPHVVVAAFKIFHDRMRDEDVAILWLPAKDGARSRKVVAKRQRRALMTGNYEDAISPELQDPNRLIRVSFNPAKFDIAEVEENDYPLVPVERFLNSDAIGEFEDHIPLLDRINHMILQRVTIATLQAFRQRGIELAPGSPDLATHDAAGRKIDYDDIFSADPGALWKLPAGAKIWESGQVDLTSILAAVKDDVMHLAAVTRTPMSMFSSDAVNQSAEGAGLIREGQTFKVRQLQRMMGRGYARTMSHVFSMMGDTERADLAKLSVEWGPAEVYSLQEMAAADSQIKILPKALVLAKVWQMEPDEVDRALAAIADDALQAQVAAQQAAIQAAALKPDQPAGAVNDGSPPAAGKQQPAAGKPNAPAPSSGKPAA